MPTPTREQLRAEIPFIKWYPTFDKFILAAILYSILFHMVFVRVAQWLPPPKAQPVIHTAMFVPQFHLPADLDQPLPTPEPKTAAKPAKTAGGPGSGGPGDAAATPVKGILATLEQNRHLLEMIVVDTDTPGLAHGIKELSAMPKVPVGGVRVAHNGDRLALGDRPARAVTIDIAGLPMPKPGPVAIGDRKVKKVRSSVHEGLPLVTGGGNAQARQLVRRALRAKHGAVKYCYEKALNTQPHLAGKISVRVTFGADGAVRGVSIVGDSLGAPQVAACIVRRLQNTKTAAALGEPISATIPYLFAAID